MGVAVRPLGLLALSTLAGLAGFRVCDAAIPSIGSHDPVSHRVATVVVYLQRFFLNRAVVAGLRPHVTVDLFHDGAWLLGLRQVLVSRLETPPEDKQARTAIGRRGEPLLH